MPFPLEPSVEISSRENGYLCVGHNRPAGEHETCVRCWPMLLLPLWPPTIERATIGTSYRAAIVASVAQDFGLPQLLRRRLKAQADLFAALTSHPTLIGTGREDALAELFRQFMPRRFEILEGTVAIVDADQEPTRSTNQLDMIVADTMDFPTLIRSGNVAVVLAQSVRAVMEVKSDLKRGASFISALVQIARARQLLKPTDPVFTGMFSFGAPTNPDTLRDWIDDVVALRFLLATKQGDPRIEKLRDALLKKDDDHGVEIADEDELLAVLANSNLPDVIAADHGAIARKIGGPNGPNLYKFLGGGEDVPTVMVLIDQFVEQLGTSATPSVQGALAVLRAHLAIDLVVDPRLGDLQLPEPTPPSNVAS